ncbi:MAG: YbdK family carboxylate-amine ligase [Mariprofundus sp.]|nr:YbdK family carboxylate-amine ligase [Mariprofundus sp.]
MSKHTPCIPFQNSAAGTLGVEMEWMTVDTLSGEQVPAAPFVFKTVGDSARIKPELFTSTVEINTDIHTCTADAIDQLQTLHHQVSQILATQQASLLSSGTHPISRWRDQQLTDDDRYARLLVRLQMMARRFNIFGTHVHIGMKDGNTCIHAMNHLLPIMPVFLAISANSPFWQGEDTGLAASRIKIFEGLSQGGMPFYFDDWHDFEHCASRLLSTGSIDSVRDIWWEMRPHPDFGTLEIRIADMLVNKDDAAAYVAYVRAEAIAAMHADKTPHVHPSLIRENRWRASRYGMHATMIDPFTEQLIPLLDWLEMRLNKLAQYNINTSELELVAARLQPWRKHGGGAAMQRALYKSDNNFPSVINMMRQQDGWNQ